MLAQPTAQVDMSTLQFAVERLLADIDMILEARVPESESPSVETAEETVMATLFSTYEIPPPPPREHDKRRKGQAEDGLKHGRRSAVRWRLGGEPHLLMKRRTWAFKVYHSVCLTGYRL